MDAEGAEYPAEMSAAEADEEDEVDSDLFAVPLDDDEGGASDQEGEEKA